jgi:hypothetical protein
VCCSGGIVEQIQISAGLKRVEIKPFTSEMATSVNAFNRRMSQGGWPDWQFPENGLPRFPWMSGRSLYQELFLTLDKGEVRGGYALTHNQFVVGGQTFSLACGPQFNLSEGVLNPSYGLVGLLQLQDALRRQPLLYGLGLGGMDKPLAQLLSAARWTLYPVPLYFKVLNAPAFLGNVAHLRTHWGKRFAAELLRHSRLGALGLRAAQLRLTRTDSTVRGEIAGEFRPWANAIWERCRSQYSLIGLRDETSLDLYYPAESRFQRLQVFRGSQAIGWAVVLDTRMNQHKHFGDLRVGTIVDCLALPQDAEPVAQCATRWLTSAGVDLIVTNQTSSAWGKALHRAGFLRGPSNFIMSLSPQLLGRLQPFETTREQIHINRGDPAELPYSEGIPKLEAAS